MPVMGITKQPVVFGDDVKHSVTVDIDFLVVDVASSYNVVLGRSTLCSLKAVVSQPHLCLKFPTPDGVGIVKGDQKMAKECYHTAISGTKYEKAIAITPEETARGDPAKKRKISAPEPFQSMSIEYVDQRPEDLEQEKRPGAVEPVEIIHAREGDSSKTFCIGTQMSGEEKVKLIICLRKNVDVFAWDTAEMPGLSAEVAVHKIPTDPLSKPVQQRCRPLYGEKELVVREEVERLFKVSFIREVMWPRWISKPVVVALKGSGGCVWITAF